MNSIDEFKAIAQAGTWQIPQGEDLFDQLKVWNVCTGSSDDYYRTLDSMLSCIVQESEVVELEQGARDRLFLYRNSNWFEITKRFVNRVDALWDEEWNKGHEAFARLSIPQFREADIAQAQAGTTFTRERAYNSLM